jgi:alpha-1,3-fucosyltransferase
MWLHTLVSRVNKEVGSERSYNESAENVVAQKPTPLKPISGGPQQSRDTRAQSRDTLIKTSNVSEGEYRKEPTRRFFRILAWTNGTRTIPFWYPRGLEDTADCGTPVPCTFTNNHSLYTTSDVVLFHTRYARKRNMPTFRLPHQHWITYLHEAPTQTDMFVESPHHSWFNWTLTYSMLGDIVVPYGICLPNREKVANDPSSITAVIRLVYGKSAESLPWLDRRQLQQNYTVNYARGKTGLVFWAVGHCKTESLREKYVAELKRYIHVDIRGNCVRNHIKDKNDGFRIHKFYLAFENSICPDYITEKTWLALSGGIVPIVLGGADYKTFLPHHSYIDIKDFSSPKALATYLNKLDRNDTLYNEYFAWRRNYTCRNGIPRGESKFCKLCRFINKNMNKTNTIADINKVWSPENCIPTEKYYRDIATLSYNDVFLNTTAIR